jgi:hypothetical protein
MVTLKRPAVFAAAAAVQRVLRIEIGGCVLGGRYLPEIPMTPSLSNLSHLFYIVRRDHLGRLIVVRVRRCH